MTAYPDPGLTRAYRRCRRVAAEHGRTYYLATRLLPAERRPAVHALYAFARLVDDIVDIPPPGDLSRHAGGPERHPTTATETLDAVAGLLHEALAVPGPAPGSFSDPPPGSLLGSADEAVVDVLTALADTVGRYTIDPRHFRVFLHSMRMDLPGDPLFRNRYPDMAALTEYMAGSAAAIGLQMLPILGVAGSIAEAEPAAAALGNAFQLTNFLRDIREDLDRDRIYLPADALAAFGVDEELLRHCARTGHTDTRVRWALAHLIAVNRDLYRRATSGIDLLVPRVRPGIRAAAVLYAAILDQIEESDYSVFDRRATVPVPRRARLTLAALGSAQRAVPGESRSRAAR